MVFIPTFSPTLVMSDSSRLSMSIVSDPLIRFRLLGPTTQFPHQFTFKLSTNVTQLNTENLQLTHFKSHHRDCQNITELKHHMPYIMLYHNHQHFTFPLPPFSPFFSSHSFSSLPVLCCFLSLEIWEWVWAFCHFAALNLQSSGFPDNHRCLTVLSICI